MSDEKSSMMIEIGYCPCLGLYRYRRSDGDEWLWAEDHLETVVAAYQAQGDERQAQFLCSLTALARRHPHKSLLIDATKGALVSVDEPPPTQASKDFGEGG